MSAPKTVDRVEIYTDKQQKLRWTFRAGGNNKILADSGQGYAKMEDVYTAIRKVTGRLPTEHPDYSQDHKWPQILLKLKDESASKRWEAWAWSE